MSTFINTIDKLGDDVVFHKIVDRTITEFKDNTVKKVGMYAFRGCSALKIAILPSVYAVDAQAFARSGIELVDFTTHVSFGAQSFGYCNQLVSVILRSIRRCDMTYSNIFDGTPIQSGTGYIYVPRALLSDTDSTMDYRRATNWATYANQFRALEDFTVDGTITGELDESKI